jgi:hypothetical protein
MPRRSNQLQRVVLAIHHQLAGRASVTESRLLPDRLSGKEREVDIAIETDVGEYPVVLSIECCDKSRPATVEWVEQMIGKHSSLPTDKLILVSRSGFTEAALSKARTGGAEALSFQQAESVDWTKVVHRINRLILETTVAITRVLSGSDADATDQTRLLPRDQLVFSADGKWEVRIESLEDSILSDKVLRSHTMDLVTVETGKRGWLIGLPFADGTYTIDELGNRQPIEGISVAVVIRRERLSLDLRTALFRDFHVAYGEATEDSSRAVLVILEREGTTPAGVLLYTHDGIQEVSRLPGEAPVLNPAPDGAVRALLRDSPTANDQELRPNDLHSNHGAST